MFASFFDSPKSYYSKKQVIKIQLIHWTVNEIILKKGKMWVCKVYEKELILVKQRERVKLYNTSLIVSWHPWSCKTNVRYERIHIDYYWEMKYLETPNSFSNGIYEKMFEITHNRKTWVFIGFL